MKKRYGIHRVCAIWGIARSSLYYGLAQIASTVPSKKRGPKPMVDDARLAELLKEVIAQRLKLGFHGEGYRKLRAVLRMGSLTREPIRVSDERLRRVMREQGLQSQYRTATGTTKAHDGTIITNAPDVMWGTDMTSIELSTGRKGNVFAVIDHCTQECIGFSVSDDATRFSAIEPVKLAVEYVYGRCDAGVATATTLRHDCGSAYLSEFFQEEIEFLGLDSSPAFVREPQGNGVVERFFRTLKEQLLWMQRYDTIEQLRAAVADWINKYNNYWLVAKHGHKTPAEVRAMSQLKQAA